MQKRRNQWVLTLDHQDVSLDIHHIFPRACCEDEGIGANTFNSIVNKTPISYKANRMIGRKAPSEYLQALQSHKQVGLSDSEMDNILSSHCIPVKEMRSDDFSAFYDARKRELLKAIETAMGKASQRDQSSIIESPSSSAQTAL